MRKKLVKLLREAKSGSNTSATDYVDKILQLFKNSLPEKKTEHSEDRDISCVDWSCFDYECGYNQYRDDILRRIDKEKK